MGGTPARRTSGWVALGLGGLVLINLYVFVWDKDTSIAAISTPRPPTPTGVIPAAPLEQPAPMQPRGGVNAPVGPPGTIDGKIGKSDTLGRVLKKSGLTGPEADEVIRSLSGVFDFKTLRAGQTFHIERGGDGRVRKFELVLSKVQRIRAERGANGQLTGTADTSQTRVELKTIGGRIDSSLYAAIKGSGETAALVDFFVDVFAYDLDFYNDTHEGDTFRVVVEKELKDGAGQTEFLHYKRILAAEYQGKAGTFRTYFFQPQGSEGGYFNADGESSEKTLLKTPLKFQRVTSGFDRARMHPILHTTTAHLGIDYAAPIGTPVWAAATGVVTFKAPSNGGAGNLVMLKHDSGLETAYMHLSKFADIKVGQKVKAKTIIGYVGSTGLSTGPHLHFGVKQNGAWIDPTKLTPIRSGGVVAHDLDAFRAEVARLEKSLSAIKIASR